MNFATFINISLAIVLGGAIGFERQWHQGMAGLRTNTLVAFGSACFITIGTHWGDDRVAAQLVSGMGFLGAGVILHEGPTVRGLNTAATLWCAAAAGALAGTALRLEAIYTAAGVMVINLGMQRLQAAINRRVPHPVDVETAYLIEITCDAAAASEVFEKVSLGIAKTGLEVRGMHRETISPAAAEQAGVRVYADLAAHNRLDGPVQALIEAIGNRPGVTSARWSVATAGSPSQSGSPLSAVSRR